MKKLLVACRERDSDVIRPLMEHFELLSITSLIEGHVLRHTEPEMPWAVPDAWWPLVAPVLERVPEIDEVAGAVLWNSSQPVMRALALAVQARGLPAIDLDSHGCLSTYLHGHFEADPAALHTISSPEYCEFLRHYEYPGTLHPLGRPQYDSWNRIDKQLMRRALGLPGHLPIILRTSTWTHAMSAWSRMEECFIEPEGAFLNAMLAIQKVTPVAVIYSIRPELGVDPQGMSKSLAEAGLVDCYVTKDQSLDDLIGAADLVVSPKSSAAAEAVLLDRAAIIADFRPQLDAWAWKDKGIVPVRTAEEMPHRILECLLDETTQARLSRERETGREWFFGKLPAAKAVTERIVEICSS